jgi:hypothetical protein
MQELGRIIFNGTNREMLKKIRQNTCKDTSVFKNVRDAAGAPQVVFEHIMGSVRVPNKIGAADVDVYSTGRVGADELAAIMYGSQYKITRNDLIIENFLFVVDIVKEQIKRSHALLQSTFNRLPFGSRHDAGHEIKGPRFLYALLVAINRKRYALIDQGEVSKMTSRIVICDAHLAQLFE